MVSFRLKYMRSCFCMHTYVYIYISMNIYMYVCIYVYLCVCKQAGTHARTYVHMCVSRSRACMRVYMYVRIYACVGVFVQNTSAH
jgi:hypothetical protein